ncbi:MAG: tetratricopeptide repeat protein [Magnetococcales bacterium]|nr:tetratricopeptide repeat protein [Magnetococcales bacterium]
MTFFRPLWGGIALLFLLVACATAPQSRGEQARFEGLLKKGEAYLARGNPQMALIALRKAQGLQPDHVALLSRLGVAYDQVGQTGQALTVWRRAHALKPSSGAISHNFGVALMRQGMLAEAEEAFGWALKDGRFDDRGETYYNLALIQQRRGALREMVSGLQQVLGLAPDHLPAHQLLAEHYRKMRRPDLEERHLRHILSLSSNNLDTLERLADLEMQSGQRERALPLLERIMALSPGSEAAKRAKAKQTQILSTQ